MSFQAYIDNVQRKTGKTPEQLKEEMEAAGVFSYDMKASDMVNYLKEKYDLGHGHSMGIWAYFKMKNWVETPKTKGRGK